MADGLWYVFLMIAGFLAGIINTIAGGGSFLTLPALMLFGLDPLLANGTNRVAILFSSAVASRTFHQHGLLDRKLIIRLAVPILLGVPFGASLATHLPSEAFESLFGVLFVMMAILLAMNPKRLLEKKEVKKEPRWTIIPLFFAIGVYVGFIQAGLGILLLLSMSFINTGDLKASNAIKNGIAFMVTFAATSYFVWNGLVQWAPGLLMAAGNILGGIVGAKLAIKKGNRLIFGFLIVVMVATGTKLIVQNVWSIL